VSLAGYIAAGLLIVLHFAFWERAKALHGYWNHFDEVARWFQAIDAASLLVFLCCLFGIGWKRWVGSALGIASFVLGCMYAMGL
jgi:hypothetical protein